MAGEGVLATEDDVSRACIDASTVSIDASLEVHRTGEQQVVGADIVAARGGQVLIVSTLDGHATSKLITA